MRAPIGTALRSLTLALPLFVLTASIAYGQTASSLPAASTQEAQARQQGNTSELEESQSARSGRGLGVLAKHIGRGISNLFKKKPSIPSSTAKPKPNPRGPSTKGPQTNKLPGIAIVTDAQKRNRNRESNSDGSGRDSLDKSRERFGGRYKSQPTNSTEAEKEKKDECKYVHQPETSAKEGAPWIMSSKDTVDSLIIREYGSTDKTPRAPDAERWDFDSKLILKVGSDPLYGAYVAYLPGKISVEQAAELIHRMFEMDKARGKEKDGCRYDYIEPNYPVKLLARPNPNDPAFQNRDQWNLIGKSQINQGADFQGAWEVLANWLKEANPLTPAGIVIIDDGFFPTTFPTEIGQQNISEVPLSPGGFGVGGGPIGTGPNRVVLPFVATPNFICSNLKKCHGGEVSSIIGAVSNNGFSIAGALGKGLGLGWDSPGEPEIFPIFPIAMGGHADDWHLAEAIKSTINVRMHAPYQESEIRPKVLNISTGSDWECVNPVMDAVKSAIDAKIVVVASAGNLRPPLVHWKETAPASCKGVISVSAHDKVGLHLPNIYPGDYLKTISAPGYSIPRLAFGKPNQITTAEWGSSFAAPEVSAVVAMMLAVKPLLTGPDISKILLQTGKPDPMVFSNKENLDLIKRDLRGLSARAALEAITLQPPSPPIQQDVLDKTGKKRRPGETNIQDEQEAQSQKPQVGKTQKKRPPQQLLSDEKQ
jgi:hypothetical protein